MSGIRRAFEVLSLLSSRPDGMGIQELHEVSMIPLGSLHRVLLELVEGGYVGRADSNARYFLGPAVRRITETSPGTSAIAAAIAPELRRVAAETGETVFLTELHGIQALCTSLFDGTRSLRLYVRLGQRMPLHASAAARILLAHMSANAARMLLSVNDLERYQETTPSTVDEVMARFPRILEDGYDVANEEFETGVWAIAAPVRSSTGRVVASLTLAGAAARLTDPHLKESSIAAVGTAVARMSGELGWVAPQEGA